MGMARQIARFAGCVVIAAVLSAPVALQAQEKPGAGAAVTEQGQAGFEARIQAAYGKMSTEGQFEAGYAELRAVLAELAKTELFAFTVQKYTDAGRIFHQNGFGQEAEEIFAEGEQARAMQEDVRERADFYLAYAEFKVAARDFPRIVPLYTTAANLYATYYGRESREVMNANDLLAVALAGLGQFGTAAGLQQSNYDLAMKNLGPEDALTWRFANNLADTFRALGAPGRALELDLMLLQKRTERYGRNHFNVLVTANNMAQDYLGLGDHAGAMRSFELNRQIAAALREQDPGWEVQAQTWLLYTQLSFGKAAFDAKSIAEMDSVITNPGYPALLAHHAARLLAGHFASIGDSQRSFRHLEQALEIANSQMSPFHPLAFATRRAIANARAATDPDAAAAEYAKLDTEMLRWLSEQVMFSGSRVVGEATRALADDMLHGYALLAEKNPSVVTAFADAARRWPSLNHASRENVYKLMRLIDRDDRQTMEMLRQILRISRSMQEIYASGAESDLGNTLLDESQAFEKTLNERLAERYADRINQASLEKPLPMAREVLGDGEALVAYFTTRKWKPDRQAAEPFEDVRLYAIVSRKDAEPRLHYLGDPREIATGETPLQLASLRSTRTERGAMPIGEMEETFAGLDDRLIAPLAADLAGASTLFVIPDGQLFAVPFSLLTDDKGRLLEERFTVRLLTSPEALYDVGAQQTLNPAGSAVLAGGLDYAKDGEVGAAPLPATLKEIDAVGALLGRDGYVAERLTGGQATETVLRTGMEKATIAHLATHGSYRSARNGGAANVDTLWQSEVILSASGDRHSMARNENDGRLYAFELMTWDLSKLDLLVLSACETGRGEETFVGGLRGLPTAISISGARRSLLTLWPVADEGTANFMVRYYEHLVGGMSYAEALRQTRRDAIAGGIEGAKSPQVWAAFVMFEN